MQPPDESQLWCHSPGPSLWKLIAEYVPESELSKIYTALGHVVVDMYTEVHSEAVMWHKMWQESQRGGQNSSRTGTPLSSLTDPPAIKELVRAEVKMLLQTLRERASRGGRDGEELLLRYKPETVSYALGHLDSSNSDCISRGDTDNGSRPSSSCSVRSCAEDEIEAVRDKLNITDIDQVVDHLKSILVEECEMLNSLVRFFKRNIKQRCRSQSECEISEPSLAELRDLRGVIQDELELYPSSLAASPHSLPVKELKTKFRLSAGQKASDETLQSLHSSLVLRPHPPSPLCLPKPRPPVGPRLTKTSASSKPVLPPSLSRTYSQHRGTVLSSKMSRTPICSKLTTLGQVNSHSPLISDQIMVKSKHHCGLSPERDSTDLHHRPWTSSPRFQTQPQRNLPFLSGDDPSSHHSIIHSLSSECDPSAQRERQSFSVSNSRNNSIPTSLIPALCHMSGFRNSSIDHSGSTTGESEMLNGQRKSTGIVSSLQEDNDRAKTISERSHSFVMSEPGSPSDRESKSHIDGNKSSHFRKDLIQQQSLRSCCLTDLSSHHSDSGYEQEQTKCSQSVPVQLSGKYVTIPKRQVKGKPTRVHEAQTESINMFYQPVPPSRVST
ncbi:coiled-coil domain-containing protein 24 isoform X1 [Solea solea]|uniref:coiled-coil domain-containing protein 24 isoform X1 n=1 Tax=Solea solea TaxID=90069 RepID=UPI00272ABB03|nr:coiled-coil domain-containing protein 24 isoform X1 [Solea solea]